MTGNWFEKTPSHLEQMTKRHGNIYLVGGFNPSEKYEFVSWDDDISQLNGKIKAMFQTTNQKIMYVIHHDESFINVYRKKHTQMFSRMQGGAPQ